MIYQFRVTLPGIKGFYRIYQVNSANTFYSFHKQLQADLEFPSDQPILFKALGAGGDVVARYALVDLGYGTVDDVTIEKAVKNGAVSFVYFYDTKAKKNVIITLEDEIPGNSVLMPTLMDDSKGPLPIEFENGYVAFEDLPQESVVCRAKRAPSQCSSEKTKMMRMTRMMSTMRRMMRTTRMRKKTKTRTEKKSTMRMNKISQNEVKDSFWLIF